MILKTERGRGADLHESTGCDVGRRKGCIERERERERGWYRLCHSFGGRGREEGRGGAQTTAWRDGSRGTEMKRERVIHDGEGGTARQKERGQEGVVGGGGGGWRGEGGHGSGVGAAVGGEDEEEGGLRWGRVERD